LKRFDLVVVVARLGGMVPTETPAIVVREPGSAAIARVALGEPGRDDVMIVTDHSGVSTGTDTWVMRGVFEWDALTFPLIPGYQRSGVVVATGTDATEWEPGHRVAATRSVGVEAVAPHWGAHLAVGASPRDEVFDAEGVDPVAHPCSCRRRWA
jgi:2-desacetyl-2-hydroxyethyl bacteriochlorophyllide A dehydrogenase